MVEEFFTQCGPVTIRDDVEWVMVPRSLQVPEMVPTDYHACEHDNRFIGRKQTAGDVFIAKGTQVLDLEFQQRGRNYKVSFTVESGTVREGSSTWLFGRGGILVASEVVPA